MSDIKVSAKDLRKICQNAQNPFATIDLCLDWADKAEAIAMSMQARLDALTAALEDGADLIQARMITAGEMNTGLKIVRWHKKVVELLKAEK